MDLNEDKEWYTEIYITGIGWVHDINNFDFIKEKVKIPLAISPIYKRFGILNLFSIWKLNGSYRLDLSLYEERIAAKILIELAKVEGFDKIKNVTYQGKSIA